MPLFAADLCAIYLDPGLVHSYLANLGPGTKFVSLRK